MKNYNMKRKGVLSIYVTHLDNKVTNRNQHNPYSDIFEFPDIDHFL
jgi:hypothetical protein